MTARSGNVTKRLLESLLKDQKRRAERERTMSYAEKLRVVDQLIADAGPEVDGLKYLVRNQSSSDTRATPHRARHRRPRPGEARQI